MTNYTQGKLSEVTGFEFVDHDPFPMVEIKLNGKTISPKKLVEVAEQMRVTLLEYGVIVKLENAA